MAKRPGPPMLTLALDTPVVPTSEKWNYLSPSCPTASRSDRDVPHISISEHFPFFCIERFIYAQLLFAYSGISTNKHVYCIKTFVFPLMWFFSTNFLKVCGCPSQMIHNSVKNNSS